MTEVWLRGNPRVFLLVLLVTVPIALLGAWLAVAQGTKVVGSLLIGLGGLPAVLAAVYARRPRLACDGRSLLMYVRWRAPLRVPLSAVEAFLMGQGPTYLPGERASHWETTTVVVKLADRYPEWSRVTVSSLLAHWCNHYVTIHGTWTEPLSVEVVNRLNAKLAAAAPRAAMYAPQAAS